MEYGPGDVVMVLRHGNIPYGKLVTVVDKQTEGTVSCYEVYRCQDSSSGLIFKILPEHLGLYRRHIDSPLRAQDNERFWKQHPPTKRK